MIEKAIFRGKVTILARVYLNPATPDTPWISDMGYDKVILETLYTGAQKLKEDKVVDFSLLDEYEPDIDLIRERKRFCFNKNGRVIAVYISARCTNQELMDSWLNAWKKLISYIVVVNAGLYTKAEFSSTIFMERKNSEKE